MSEIEYKDLDLHDLKYIKLAFEDFEGNTHDIRTEIDFMGDKFISVFYKHEEDEDFDIRCPQDVSLKLITDEKVYVGETLLQEVKKSRRCTFFTMPAPKVLDTQQNRRYYRVKLDRVCILVATDKDGHSTTFMSRMIDISVGGVLVYKLETMYSDEYVSINPSDYERYNIVLILGTAVILKMTARYVRKEETDKTYKYAFEFIDLDEKNTNIISKFVTQEQLQQLKLRNKYK